jgi:hypothetical protein
MLYAEIRLHYILKWSIIPVTFINYYNDFEGGWLVSGVSVLWLVEKEFRRESWCASRKSALHWRWRYWKGRALLHQFCLKHRNVYFLHACTILYSLLCSRRNNWSLDGRLANGERWELGPNYWAIWPILCYWVLLDKLILHNKWSRNSLLCWTHVNYIVYTNHILN